MKNCIKSKNWTLSEIIVILTVTAISLSGCMSMFLAMGKTQYKDYGIYDNSVPEDQMCELRFGMVIVTSFNGVPVDWGNTPNANLGHVKIPSGINTIVFDWIEQKTEITDRDVSDYQVKTTYTTTTKSVNNITFSDVIMLPGHTYFIIGRKQLDGYLRFLLMDQTSMPSGFYGDKVPKSPKKSKIATEIEGTWKNSYGETFELSGNSFIQTLPPYVGENTGPNQLRQRGLFELSNGIMILHATDQSIDGGMWIDLSYMENKYYYKYSLKGNNLLLELPYMFPEMVYMKQ